MTKEYIDKKDVQEKDEESSHQRETKLQGIKYKKIQSKNKQTLLVRPARWDYTSLTNQIVTR